MTLDFRADGAPLPLDLQHLIVAGWTGRDADAIAHHIEELAALGVPAPSQTPLYYRVSAPLLTTAPVIEAVGEASSGEVEPLIEEIKTLLEAEKVRVIDIHGGTSRSGPLSITVYLSTRDRFQGPRLTERVCALEGVKEARWKGIRTD